MWKDNVTTVTPAVTPHHIEALPVTERVTIASPLYALVTRGVTKGVTERIAELERENAFLRSEIERLTPKTNAQRQRVYRERHHSS